MDESNGDAAPVRAGAEGRRAAPFGSWETVLADVEGEFASLLAAEQAAEWADEVRLAVGRLRLLDRLGAARDAGVRTSLVSADGHRWVARVYDVGPDWVLLETERGRSVLLPLSAVAAVTLSSGQVRSAGEGEVWRRFGLRRILARLTRDRAVVDIGAAGQVWRGRLEAVGEDHLLLAPVEPGELRPIGDDLVALSLVHLTAVECELRCE